MNKKQVHAESLLSKKQRLHELPEGLVILFYVGLPGCMPNDTALLDSFESLVDYTNQQLKAELDNCFEQFSDYEEGDDSDFSPLGLWKDSFYDGMGISLKRVGKDKDYYTLSKRGINLLWEDFLAMVVYAQHNALGAEQTIFEFEPNRYSFTVGLKSENEEEF